MTSRAGQLISSPGWGAAPAEPRRARPRPILLAPRATFAAGGSRASDAAGAALVLGGAIALWAAFLAAVW